MNLKEENEEKIKIWEKNLIEKKILFAELNYEYLNKKLKKKNASTQTNDFILENLYSINEEEKIPINHISKLNLFLNDNLIENNSLSLNFDYEKFNKLSNFKTQNNDNDTIINIKENKKLKIKKKSENFIYTLFNSNLFENSKKNAKEYIKLDKNSWRIKLSDNIFNHSFLNDECREIYYPKLCNNNNNITKNFQKTKLKNLINTENDEKIDLFFENKFKEEIKNNKFFKEIMKTKIIFEDFRPDIKIEAELELLLFILSEFLNNHNLTRVFISIVLDYNEIYSIFLLNEKKLNKLKIEFEEFFKINLKDLKITYLRSLFNIYRRLSKKFFYDVLDKLGVKNLLDLWIFFKKKVKVYFKLFLKIIKYYIKFCNSKKENNLLILYFEDNYLDVCNKIKFNIKSDLMVELKNKLLKENKFKNWFF